MATPEVKYEYVTEVPSTLKQLARLLARGFYTMEDALIIDMLVRNICMKEDDMVELLHFEKKQFRTRVFKLRSDKFIQLRLKMETSSDGKAQKVNYYFINFKSFVNVVKYKLDIMRKRMETKERDATSISTFKCTSCDKTFTDLDADKIFDTKTEEFRCTYCGDPVEEDTTAMVKRDSSLLLARFNDQLEPLYELLREIEGIKLAPEILEPKPVDMNTIRGVTKPQRIDNQQWSGEATRSQGFTVEDSRIDRNLGQDLVEKKSRPVWMTESTIRNESNVDLNIADTVTNDSSQSSVLQTTSSGTSSNRNKNETEDIMSLLLLHEIQPEDQFSKNLKIVSSNHNLSDSDESDDDRSVENTDIPDIDQNFIDSKSEDDMPSVLVGGKSYPINEINEELIAQMTEQEKEKYINVYQEQFSDICY